MVKTSPSNTGCSGSIPDPGAKIPHASGPKDQNVKQKQCCNKFNKDFKKNGPRQKSLKEKKEKRKNKLEKYEYDFYMLKKALYVFDHICVIRLYIKYLKGYIYTHTYTFQTVNKNTEKTIA